MTDQKSANFAMRDEEVWRELILLKVKAYSVS